MKPIPDMRNSSDNNRPRPQLALLAMMLLMAGGIVALVTFGFDGAAVHSVPLNKLLAERDKQLDQHVRVVAELVPGSFIKREKSCEFRVRNKDQELEIRYSQCRLPECFCDVPQGGMIVAAAGSLASAGHFEATAIMAKCTRKYDPERRPCPE